MEDLKLLVGKELTYYDLTKKVLNEEPKKGGSKNRQLKQIKSLCDLEVIKIEGKKNFIYIIKEVYDKPKVIKDKRKVTLENAPYFIDTLPELQKAMYIKDKEGNRILKSNITLTKSKLIYRVFGLPPTGIEQKHKDKIYNLFHEDSIEDKRKYIDNYSLEVTNFFWNKVLRNGVLDKLEGFDKGTVKVVNCVGIKTEYVNADGDGINEDITYLHLDKEDSEIVEKAKKDMAKRLGKKSTALFSNEEKEELHLLIANRLGIEGEIFLYNNYCIDICDALDVIADVEKSNSDTEDYRNKIFKEFYNQHISKHYESNFTKFMIYTTLYISMYYRNQVNIMPPFEEEQREKYENEIKRLREEVKELKQSNEEKDRKIMSLEEEIAKLKGENNQNKK